MPFNRQYQFILSCNTADSLDLILLPFMELSAVLLIRVDVLFQICCLTIILAPILIQEGLLEEEFQFELFCLLIVNLARLQLNLRSSPL